MKHFGINTNVNNNNVDSNNNANDDDDTYDGRIRDKIKWYENDTY